MTGISAWTMDLWASHAKGDDKVIPTTAGSVRLSRRAWIVNSLIIDSQLVPFTVLFIT